MTKRIVLLIIISMILVGCSSQEEFITAPPTMVSTVIPAIVHTQLALPIASSVVGSIARKSNDFLPSPAPLPSATPANVFVPVADKDGYSDLVITLEKMGCLGRCPAYSLTIHGNGTGIYEGKMNVMVERSQEFTLLDEELAELVRMFDAVHYFSFEGFYSCGILDAPITVTSITFQGHSKIVGHSGGCADYEKATLPAGQPYYPAPRPLCNLEKKIEEMVNAAQWIGK